MPDPRHRRRPKRILKACLLLPLALVAIAAAGAVFVFVFCNGPRLGKWVTENLPPMRGTVKLQSINWSWDFPIAYLTNTAADIEIQGFEMRDPDGTEVLYAPSVKADLDVHALLQGRFIANTVTVSRDTRWRFAEKPGRPGYVTFLEVFLPPRRHTVATQTPPPQNQTTRPLRPAPPPRRDGLT